MPLHETVLVSHEAGCAPDGVPLNGFLMWLQTADNKKVRGLARAFHFAMQPAGCDVHNFSRYSLRRQWEHLRASLPSRPAVTQAVAHCVKASPQEDLALQAAGQHPAVPPPKTNPSTGSHSDPAQLYVGCNVQWTFVSDQPSQPMCARVLGGFPRSHFHDNLCTVLDEYVQAEVSFANVGVPEEARAFVEQGGTVITGGWTL